VALRLRVEVGEGEKEREGVGVSLGEGPREALMDWLEERVREGWGEAEALPQEESVGEVEGERVLLPVGAPEEEALAPPLPLPSAVGEKVRGNVVGMEEGVKERVGVGEVVEEREGLPLLLRDSVALEEREGVEVEEAERHREGVGEVDKPLALTPAEAVTLGEPLMHWEGAGEGDTSALGEAEGDGEAEKVIGCVVAMPEGVEVAVPPIGDALPGALEGVALLEALEHCVVEKVPVCVLTVT
jgi:hypothetical protein